MSRYIDLASPPGDQVYTQRLNRCYQEQYLPALGDETGQDRVLGFGVWCEHQLGIRLHLQPQTLEGTYSLQGLTILDQARFNWWLLQWD